MFVSGVKQSVLANFAQIGRRAVPPHLVDVAINQLASLLESELIAGDVYDVGNVPNFVSIRANLDLEPELRRLGGH
jgi:hypothetical protein